VSVQDTIARLADARIQVVPADLEKHYILERDGFIALVERAPDGGFGRPGAAGLLTEKGLAPLMWRGPSAFFVAKSFEVSASAEQIAALRAFQSDLESALLA
jgi:hypothetical protein